MELIEAPEGQHETINAFIYLRNALINNVLMQSRLFGLLHLFQNPEKTNYASFSDHPN